MHGQAVRSPSQTFHWLQCLYWIGTLLDTIGSVDRPGTLAIALTVDHIAGVRPHCPQIFRYRIAYTILTISIISKSADNTDTDETDSIIYLNLNNNRGT